MALPDPTDVITPPCPDCGTLVPPEFRKLGVKTDGLLAALQKLPGGVLTCRGCGRQQLKTGWAMMPISWPGCPPSWVQLSAETWYAISEPGPAISKADQAQVALLRVYTNGVADERILKAAELVADDSLKADDKLTKIDALLPFPATASAEQLGELLGVSKQAILKTRWWADHRKGEKQDEIGRRAMAHRKRAEGQQTPDTTDDDGAW
jgi:hypothetical protein